MRKLSKQQRGFTLTEVIVAGVILSLLLATALSIYPLSKRWFERAHYQLIAVQYARNVFERLLEEDFSSNLLTEGTHNKDSADTPDIISITEGEFKYEYDEGGNRIDKFNADRYYEVVDNTWDTTNIKEIKVTVEWDEPDTKQRKTESIIDVIVEQ